MTSPDIYYSDATELARLLRTRELSCAEVARTFIERIDAINPEINAIVAVAEDLVQQASAADAALARGENLGPLHGVPVTIKDCLDTAGLRTARGSRLFANHVPSGDATVVARLRSAGAIILGKTNLPEFSYARESENLLSGRTVNPWNRQRTPGGSSGGEAAAISAGLSPLGIGSDVALSIRVPAHFCGVVGLKPTHGRVPFTGHWPDTLRRYWHVGPMARSVRDVALALQLISGPDGKDGYLSPFSHPSQWEDHDSLTSLRIGWLADRGFGPVDPDVVSTVREAAVLLSRAGLRVDEASIPVLENLDCNVTSAKLFAAEAIPYFQLAASGREAEIHGTTRRVIASEMPPTQEYIAAQLDVERLRDAMASFFEDHDALLCPVAPVPAHAHELTVLDIGGASLPSRHVVRCTAPFNLTGAPALSVPFGWSRAGLPIGVQIVGRHFDERTVLHLGAALERLREPRMFRPIP